jgi:predicted dehydrogenase
MKTSLIVGLGIGELYSQVLTKLGHKVVTVDPNPAKNADFYNIHAVVSSRQVFDTVHICTPNFTHENIARTIAPFARIVFIEKPGVVDSNRWKQLIEDFPSTRFMMVKNNMWRNNISTLRQLAEEATQVDIKWIRKNCIPHPGSWFTTKELAFGGVSRDLMPHLLSIYIALNKDWQTMQCTKKSALQLWELDQIQSTEYGVVNPSGKYDVDDQCAFQYNDKWQLESSWRSMTHDDSSINFVFENGQAESFELGWCPEEAYLNMIKDAVDNVENNKFWVDQFNQDHWIHQQIENL